MDGFDEFGTKESIVNLLDLNSLNRSNIKVIISCRTSEITDNKINYYLQLKDTRKPTIVWHICPFDED